MGDLNPFKAPKQDTSALQEQQKLAKEKEEKIKAEEEALKKKKIASLKAKQSGGRGTLLQGLETGVTPEKSTQLG